MSQPGPRCYRNCLVMVILANILQLVSTFNCPDSCYCEGTTNLLVRCIAVSNLTSDVDIQLTTIPQKMTLEVLCLNRTSLDGIPEGLPATTANALTTFTMRDCGVEQLNQQYGFSAMRKLSYLNLSRNKLRRLDISGTDMFSSTLVNEIDFSHNQINYIKSGLFLGLRQLSKIYLQNNHLEKIKPGMFKIGTYLNFLDTLDLSFNSITEVGHNSFQTLARLKNLKLQNNKLTVFDTASLNGLISLQKLYLRNNNIKEIVHDELLNTTALKFVRYLDLSFNNLVQIKENAFGFLPSLSRVGLNDNQIITVDSKAFVNLQSLGEIHMERNSIKMFQTSTVVNCPSLYALFLKENQIDTFEINAVNWTNIHKPDFTLDLSFNNLKNVNCKAVSHRFMNSLFLHGNRIQKITESFDKAMFSILDLSNNSLTKISNGWFNDTYIVKLKLSDNVQLSAIDQDAFVNASIGDLDISNCSFSIFPPAAVPALSRIQRHDTVVDISNNNVHLYIPENTFNTLPISKLKLDNVTINNMDFMSTTKVDVLYVNGLKITSTQGKANFVTSIKASSTKHLYFRNAELDIIPAGFSGVKEMDVSYNDINTFDNIPKSVESVTWKRNVSPLNFSSTSFQLVTQEVDFTGCTFINTDFLAKATRLQRVTLDNVDLSRQRLSFTASVRSISVLSMNFANLNFFPQAVRNMRSLVTLKLQGNRLKQIKRYYFGFYVRELTHIDLSMNEIEKIEKSTFIRMSYLMYLNISHNRIQTLESAAFPAASILVYQLQLDVSFNVIDTLDESLAGALFNIWYIGRRKGYRVYMEGNSLHCNCELMWLGNRMFQYQSRGYTDLVPKGTCKSPHTHEFSRILSSDFVCYTPDTLDVKVIVLSDNSQIVVCSATSDPACDVSLLTINGRTLATSYARESKTAYSTSVSHVVTHSSPHTEFTCKATNSHGTVLRNFTIFDLMLVETSQAPLEFTTTAVDNNVYTDPTNDTIIALASTSDDESGIEIYILVIAIVLTFILTAIVISILWILLLKRKRFSLRNGYKGRLSSLNGRLPVGLLELQAQAQNGTLPRNNRLSNQYCLAGESSVVNAEEAAPVTGTDDQLYLLPTNLEPLAERGEYAFVNDAFEMDETKRAYSLCRTLPDVPAGETAPKQDCHNEASAENMYNGISSDEEQEGDVPKLPLRPILSHSEINGSSGADMALGIMMDSSMFADPGRPVTYMEIDELAGGTSTPKAQFTQNHPRTPEPEETPKGLQQSPQLRAPLPLNYEQINEEDSGCSDSDDYEHPDEYMPVDENDVSPKLSDTFVSESIPKEHMQNPNRPVTYSEIDDEEEEGSGSEMDKLRMYMPMGGEHSTEYMPMDKNDDLSGKSINTKADDIPDKFMQNPHRPVTYAEISESESDSETLGVPLKHMGSFDGKVSSDGDSDDSDGIYDNITAPVNDDKERSEKVSAPSEALDGDSSSNSEVIYDSINASDDDNAPDDDDTIYDTVSLPGQTSILDSLNKLNDSGSTAGDSTEHFPDGYFDMSQRNLSSPSPPPTSSALVLESRPPGETDIDELNLTSDDLYVNEEDLQKIVVNSKSVPETHDTYYVNPSEEQDKYYVRPSDDEYTDIPEDQIYSEAIDPGSETDDVDIRIGSPINDTDIISDTVYSNISDSGNECNNNLSGPSDDKGEMYENITFTSDMAEDSDRESAYSDIDGSGSNHTSSNRNTDSEEDIYEPITPVRDLPPRNTGPGLEYTSLGSTAGSKVNMSKYGNEEEDSETNC